MTNVLPFQARPVLTSPVQEAEAQTAHTPEVPLLRMYFKTPDGRIARSTLHTTMEIDHQALNRALLKEIERLHAQIMALMGGTHLTMHVMNVLRIEAQQPRASQCQGPDQQHRRCGL